VANQSCRTQNDRREAVQRAGSNDIGMEWLLLENTMAQSPGCLVVPACAVTLCVMLRLSCSSRFAVDLSSLVSLSRALTVSRAASA
jgi:hypothetical protein